MLERKVVSELLKWKNSKNKKCLVLQGARQVGKTFAVEMFGARNYDEVLSINFKETPSAAEIFSGDLSIDTLMLSLKFRYPQYEFKPGEILIFLDEIQECEEAITSLKFWTIDGRFDVIASGSMLGIDYKRASSYPVGYVDYITMHGLDFEEFLWSQGIETDLIDTLGGMFAEKSIVPKSIHSRMMNMFRSYMALGGMPEVIQTFVDSSDYREADKIQKAILQGYLYDIAHYANANEKIKAEQCYLSLSGQLLEKENHKFQYKLAEKGGSARKFASSLEWLMRADIVTISNNVTTIKYDLKDYETEDNFRVYTSDLTMLLAMRDFYLKEGIVEGTVSGTTKGGLYECAIADLLTKNGHKIHFYRNETTKREIEFLIQTGGKVIPIEVKSSNSKAASLNQILKNNPDIPFAYKLIDGNVGVGENRIITMPLYMSMFI